MDFETMSVDEGEGVLLEREVSDILRAGLIAAFEKHLVAMMRHHGGLVVEQKEILLECVRELLQFLEVVKGGELQRLSYVFVQAVSSSCENLLYQLSELPMFEEIFDWVVFVESVLTGCIMDEQMGLVSFKRGDVEMCASEDEEYDGKFVSSTSSRKYKRLDEDSEMGNV